jgi:hypothetical protein
MILRVVFTLGPPSDSAAAVYRIPTDAPSDSRSFLHLCTTLPEREWSGERGRCRCGVARIAAERLRCQSLDCFRDTVQETEIAIVTAQAPLQLPTLSYDPEI